MNVILQPRMRLGETMLRQVELALDPRWRCIRSLYYVTQHYCTAPLFSSRLHVSASNYLLMSLTSKPSSAMICPFHSSPLIRQLTSPCVPLITQTLHVRFLRRQFCQSVFCIEPGFCTFIKPLSFHKLNMRIVLELTLVPGDMIVLAHFSSLLVE